MRADSFITSPSCPVRTRPLPLAEPDLMAVASMNSTSPPAIVTERPVATPGVAVRAADSWKNFWRPSASRTASTSIVTGLLAARLAAAFAVWSVAFDDFADFALGFGLLFFESFGGTKSSAGNAPSAEALVARAPSVHATASHATVSSGGACAHLYS